MSNINKMKTILISVVLALSFCNKEPSYQYLMSEKGIISLNTLSFKEKTGIDENDISKTVRGDSDWLILFYDERQEDSTKFINDKFLEINNLIKDLQFKVTAAAVSCQMNIKLCKSFRIYQRPSIYYLSLIGKNIKFTQILDSKQQLTDFIKFSHEGKQYKKNQKMSVLGMILFFIFLLSIGVILKWGLLQTHQHQTKMTPIYDKNEQMYVLSNDNVQTADLEDSQKRSENGDEQQNKINSQHSNNGS